MSSKENTIIEYLMDEIKSGKLSEGDRVPSQYKLAEMFLINKETANKALNKLVGQGVLKRKAGRGGTVVSKDVSYPKGVIGFLVYLSEGDATGFFGKILCGAQHAAHRRKYQLVFYDCNPFEINSFLNQINNTNIQGLLSSRFGMHPDNLSFPVMYVDVSESKDYGSINITYNDGYDGGCVIAEHLIKCGHRDIVFATTMANYHNMYQRWQGFAECLKKHGVSRVNERLFEVNGNSANYKALYDNIKKEFPNATAVSFSSDSEAYDFYAFLRNNGIDVPRNISITGFGAIQELHKIIKITSIEQHPVDVGFQAANKLIDIIEGKQQGPLNVIVPIELFPGETVALI